MKCVIPRKKEIKELEICIEKGGTRSDVSCGEASWKAARSILGKKFNEDNIPMGAYRMVVPLGRDCVIKLAQDIRGAVSNKSEWKNWKRIKALHNEKIREKFVPILSASKNGAWVIMPRAETNIRPGEAGSLYQDLMKLGVFCDDIQYNYANIGNLKGKLVVLDYGLGLKCDIRRKAK